MTTYTQSTQYYNTVPMQTTPLYPQQPIIQSITQSCPPGYPPNYPHGYQSAQDVLLQYTINQSPQPVQSIQPVQPIQQTTYQYYNSPSTVTQTCQYDPNVQYHISTAPVIQYSTTYPQQNQYSTTYPLQNQYTTTTQTSYIPKQTTYIPTQTTYVPTLLNQPINYTSTIPYYPTYYTQTYQSQ